MDTRVVLIVGGVALVGIAAWMMLRPASPDSPASQSDTTENRLDGRSDVGRDVLAATRAALELGRGITDIVRQNQRNQEAQGRPSQSPQSKMDKTAA